MTDAAEHSLKRGTVKQVLSGDSVVLQGPAVNGPPKEITVYLSNVNAPRLARRPTDNSEGTSDEPFAWEAREFLRTRVVGKTVVFVRDFIATSGREHGRVYLGGTSPADAENLSETAVAAGWLEVRAGKQVEEHTQKLLDLQEEAKAAKRGRWAEDGKAQEHVRNVIWQIDDPREFLDANKGKPLEAIVEQVRDGSTVRLFLLPTFEYVTVILSGVKSPQAKVGSSGRSEPGGEEAKHFVEARLLQRNVTVHLEGLNNQNFIGSVIHPRGNIAEFLLSEGLAKIVEWTLNLTTSGAQKLRECEKKAKDANLRIWKNYVSNALPQSARKSYLAKVIEIGLGDNITVVTENGAEVKAYLSSLRPPKRETSEAAPNKQFRPLYDIPYMLEAREFLRKKLIDKRVQLTLDYIQPKQEQYPEKHFYTVTYMGQNIAEQLISSGLAKALRHKQDDENRSSQYDDLLTAEAAAQKAKKGLWIEKNDKKPVRVSELQGDLARSKTYLTTFQRGSRPTGIVEFVSSGSRLRLYVPKENIVITVVLSGISCPRTARAGPGGKPLGESEPYADEAYKFTRQHLLQREVEVEVEGLDKTGGFIGYVFVKSERSPQTNIAELLVENGLASVHFTAEKSKYYNLLVAAEKDAREKKINLWKNYVEKQVDPVQVDQASDVSERKLNLKKIVITEISRENLNFWAQHASDGPAIETLMTNLGRDLGATNVSTSYTPKRHELCAGVFKEVNSWHRVKVESIKNGRADVLYVDFGNRENVPLSVLTALPAQFHQQPALAKEYKLALVAPPNDPDFASETNSAFAELSQGISLELNLEYKVGNVEAVTLYAPAEGKPIDLGKYLVEQGLALAENRKERRFQSLVKDYQEAEQVARKERRNIWRYGDFTGQDF